MFATKNSDQVTPMKGQNTNYRLREDNYDPNNKRSKQEEKYANYINRQSTKETNANKSYLASWIIRETIITSQLSAIIFVKT